MPDSTPVSGDLGRATPEVQKYRPRACQSCARSKMRCVWPSEPGATPCQRCAKIKTPCTLPEINPRRRRGPSTRVGQLEEKIDGIMSLLNASQQIQQNSPSSSGQTPPSSTPAAPAFEQSRNSIQQLLNPNWDASTFHTVGNNSSTRAAPDGSETISRPSSAAANFHTQARLVAPAGLVAPASIAAAGAGPNADTTRSPSFDSERTSRPTAAGAAGESVEIVKGFRVTLYEADRALNLYRSIYSPYFPFVPIPVMMTAHELYQRSPFLFRSIVVITTPQSPAIQAEYRVWFREYVAQHVVVHNEKRLEILQAILIYLAWGDFQFFMDSQATNLTQLAMALVIELGLNRWPMDFGRATVMMLKGGPSMSAIGRGKYSFRKKHTLDEMRASLGTFYVSSLCSTLFRRSQPMMYGSYLSKCCDALGEAQEYDSDKFLVAMVKIQQLLNRGADIIPYSDDEAAPRIQYTPSHMALMAIQKELEALIHEQPPEVECNALLWTHYHGTVCRLFEPAIYIRSSPTTTTTTNTPGGYDSSEGTARTAALWQCLNSARDFFSAYLVIPPQNLPCMPFHGAHLSFCVVTAARLMFLGDEASASPQPGGSHRDRDRDRDRDQGGGGGGGDPDWSHSLAREALNLEAVLIRIGDFFDEADKICVGLGRSARYIDQERTSLGSYRDKVRWIRNWYVGRTTSSGGGAAAYPSSSYPHYRTEEEDGGRGRSAGGGGGGGGGDNYTMLPKDPAVDQALGSVGGSSHLAAIAHGQAMDVDSDGYDMPPQAMMPGELDDVFWQAMFDLGWNGGMDLMDVQG